MLNHQFLFSFMNMLMKVNIFNYVFSLYILYPTCNQIGGLIQYNASGLVVVNSYFTLSSELNKLITIGCDDFAMISPVAAIEKKNISSGCVSVCSNIKDVPVGSCSGLYFF